MDKRYHQLVGTWDSEEHINHATLILCSMIDEIKKNIPLWTNEQQLKGMKHHSTKIYIESVLCPDPSHHFSM